MYRRKSSKGSVAVSFGLGLIVASKYLLRLDLGNDQIKFVFDFSSKILKR